MPGKEGRSEEDLIAEMQAAHERDFAGFDIEFDNYGSTHSPENRALCDEFWQSIRKAGLVKERDVEQLYDPQAGTFLADRFVRGTCPKCKSPDQPGDNCSKCGHHYSPTELIDPRSTLSGATPEVRKSPHLFIELEKLHGFLEEWTQSGEHLQPEIANYLKGHFLGEPLRDWDISRPAPYFGFEIPDSPGNYWYVWFDAPIGYMASTQQWCDRTGEKFDDWWRSPDCEIHHFIGKDITYFHTLFWPGMLKTAGYSLPAKVHIHGFLTVGGEKMSKSKGTFVAARTYLKHLDPSLPALLLRREAVVARRGSRPVGRRVRRQGEHRPGEQGREPGEPHGEVCRSDRPVGQVSRRRRPVRRRRQGGRRNSRRVRGDRLQQGHAAHHGAGRPGQSVRRRTQALGAAQGSGAKRASCRMSAPSRSICSGRLSCTCRPCCRDWRSKRASCLNDPIERWDQSQTPLVGTPVAKFTHMLQRVEEKDVQAMIEDSKPAAAPATPPLQRPRPATPRNGTTPATPSPPSRSRPSARSTISPRSTCAWPASSPPRTCRRPRSC